MNVNEEMDGVEVRLMQRQDGSRFFKVLVRSVLLPTMKMVGEVELSLLRSEKSMAQRIGVLAGAMAEELCEKYGDTIEPSNVARAAAEAFREMMAEQRGVLVERID